MSDISSRLRTDFVKPPSGVVVLGHFQSAQFNGAGQLIQWLAPEAPITTVASTIYSMGRLMRDSVFRGALKERQGFPMKSLRFALNYDPHKVVGSGTYYRRNPSNGRKDRRYVGGFMPPPSSYFGGQFADFNNLGVVLSEASTEFPSMTGLGSQAWLKTKPSFEQSSLFQDAVEFQEVRGQFSSSQQFARTARETAKEFRDSYLDHVSSQPRSRRPRLLNVISQEWVNANFGWAPFLRGIYDLSKLIGGFSNFVKKFTKMNGQPLRRRVNLSDGVPSVQTLSTVALATSSVSYAIPCFPQSFPAAFFSAPPSWTLTESVRTRVWGVGKWTFYRPEFDATLPGYSSEWNKVRQALTLSGLRITPTSLYNVIPWTWLLDWLTNVGNYVQELTDIWIDQIVGHYCFVMQAKERLRHLNMKLPFHDGSQELTFARTIATRERASANSPFGFDLTWDELTPRQLSILGAIGVSRRQ